MWLIWLASWAEAHRRWSLCFRDCVSGVGAPRPVALLRGSSAVMLLGTKSCEKGQRLDKLPHTCCAPPMASEIFGTAALFWVLIPLGLLGGALLLKLQGE